MLYQHFDLRELDYSATNIVYLKILKYLIFFNEITNTSKSNKHISQKQIIKNNYIVFEKLL